MRWWGVLLMAGLCLPGCVDVAPPPPINSIQALDMGRVAAVEASLKSDPVLAGCVIKVSAQNDLLVLDGDVPTTDAKKRAESIAGRVEGVKRIANHLNVKPGVGNPNENTDLNATPQ